MDDDAYSGDRRRGVRQAHRDVDRGEVSGLADADEAGVLHLKDGPVGRGGLEHLDRMERKVTTAGGEQRPLAAGPSAQHRFVHGGQPCLQLRDAVTKAGDFIGAKDGARHHRGAGVDASVAVETTVAECVEVSEEAVVVALRDRIVLVVVALGAGEREAEDGLAEGLHAVGVVVEQILLGDGAALVGGHVVPLEPRRDELALGASG